MDRSREQVGLIVQKIVPVERAAELFSRTLLIRLDSGVHDRSHLEQLNSTLRRYPGSTVVQLEIRTDRGYRVSMKTDAALGVRATADLAEEIRSIVGADRVRLLAGNGNGSS